MSGPLHTIRFGYIKASIWRNSTKSGDRHSVSVVRLYRNGDEWKESSRFGRDDLLLVSKAMNEAHSWIFAQGHTDDSMSANSGGQNDAANRQQH